VLLGSNRRDIEVVVRQIDTTTWVASRPRSSSTVARPAACVGWGDSIFQIWHTGRHGAWVLTRNILTRNSLPRG